QSLLVKQNRFLSKKILKFKNVDESGIVKTPFGKFKSSRHQFTRNDSPVKFRTYLTFIGDNGTFTVDHDFYVSEILETKAKPENIYHSEGDRYYLKGPTHFGIVIAAIGIIGFFVVVAASG